MAQSDSETKAIQNAPWLPFKTLITFLDYLGEVGVPQQIERSFWSRKLSGSSGPQVISALKFLSLIDDESHTVPKLDGVAVDVETRRQYLRGIMEIRYEPILNHVNLERATRGQLKTEFEKHTTLRGSILTKGVIFFVHMARYVGIPVSPHIIIRERGEAKPRKKKAESEQKIEVQSLPIDAVSAQPTRAVAIPLEDVPAQRSLLLWGLFKRLPEPGSPWSAEDRKRWLDTLSNVFALEYREQ